MGTIIMKIKETMRNQHINLAGISALLMPLLILSQPHNAVGAPITCSAGVSGCHFSLTVKDGTGRNIPDGRFTGTHARHSGYSTSSTKRQYLYACTVCHPSSGYTNAHQNGFKNITGSGLAGTSYTAVGGKKIANTTTPAFGNCNSNFCHSTGQAVNGTATPVYKPLAWGGTATCGSCHLDFNSNASATGDHVAHAQTYPFTCATCHNGYTETTVTTATHVNKVVNLAFSGNATGTSYSQGPTPAVGNGFGTCSTSYCHSTGQSTSGGATPTYPGTAPTWGTTTMNCGSCHLDFNSNASATGDHVKHAQGTANLSCATCHNGYTETAVNSATHVNKTIEISFSGTNATGTTYSQANQAVGNGFGNCTTSNCHGSGAPVWGGALYSATVICENCHGSAATSPFYSTAATGAAPTKTIVETDSKVGAHLAHLAARAGYTNAVTCGTCHNVPAAVTTAGHMNGTATPVFSGNAVLNGANPTYATSTCSNTYCHGAKMINLSNTGSDTSPSWTQTAYLTGTPSKTGDCAMCHGCPPTGYVGNSHVGTELLAACNGCHSHVNTNGTFTAGANRALHMNGIVEGGGCVSCHTLAKGTRSAVVGEFTLAWGHKKSGRGAVTDADCIVCHLEGSFSTGKVNPTYHLGVAGGNIDLRDPDGANGEIAILNNSNATFTFTKFSLDLTTARTSAITNSVADVITHKFCLKCHDLGGATNNTARAGTSPTATAPFGGGFTATNSAGQFALTNSSRHPVLGPLNKNYPSQAKLAAPYKVPTATRTASVKANSVVMNCFDCHNTPTTPLTTRTVSAHGNADTIRGTHSTAEGTTSTFCNTCHLNYQSATQESHGVGSAFNSATHGQMVTWVMSCNACHADVLAPTRLEQAVSAHGVNVLPTTGATKTKRWASATATHKVPIAFIRNTTYLTNHSPVSVNGYTTTVNQCDMVTCGGRTGSPYSPGGTY